MLRFIFTIILFITGNAFAQRLTLDHALREVLSDSPYLQSAESVSREADWKKTEALGAGFLPKFKVNGNYLTNVKYQYININFNGAPVVIPNIIPNSQFNLMAELPIFDGFASTNRYLAAGKLADAGHEKFEWEKFRTEMAVTLSFYQALASQNLRRVALQNLKALEDHKREAMLFKKSGIATNYDVLRVEVQASNAATDLADAEDEIIIAREKLAEMLGHETETRELSGELPVPDEKLLTMEPKVAVDRRDLKALRLEAMAADNAESAANRFWLPELSLFSNYIFYNNLTPGFNDWSSYRNARQVGVMMTWNLFDGGASYARSKQSIEKKVQSEKALRMGELAAIKDLSVWTRRYKSQCRIYLARKEDIKRSEESVRLAREGRRVGARTESELLDAQVDLYRSQAGAVRAQLAAIEALINLQLAEGKKYLR
jgi:outer membrane protein TolC